MDWRVEPRIRPIELAEPPARRKPDKVAVSLQPIVGAVRFWAGKGPGWPDFDQIPREFRMSVLLLIIILLLIFGGGGGYYGYRSYGGPGLGGVLGLVLVILVILWLVGGLGPYGTHV